MTPAPAGDSARQPRPDSVGRLRSIDAFRGACALAVFLTHWFLWANFYPQGEAQRLLHDGLGIVYDLFCRLTWNSGGQHPAVLGFFVLSGFCIHASRARRPAPAINSPEWPRYVLGRGRRILPVYWWGALLGAGIVLLQTAWPVPNPILNVHAAGGGRDLLVRVFALTAIVPGDVIYGNWTLNTVSTEMAIYALYPLLFLGTRRFGWAPPLLGLIALQVVALVIAPQVSPYWIVNTPLVMGAYWYVGMLAAEWQFRRALVLPGWAPLLAWGLFLALRETPDFPARYLVVQLVRSLGFAAVLLWLVGRETRRPSLGRSLTGRFLCLAGEVSYSLYAVHTPVILATTWALGRWPGSHGNALQLLLTLLTCVAGTALTYRFIERPFLRSRPAAIFPYTPPAASAPAGP